MILILTTIDITSMGLEALNVLNKMADLVVVHSDSRPNGFNVIKGNPLAKIDGKQLTDDEFFRMIKEHRNAS